MKLRFFNSPKDFRAWLAKNHAVAGELHVGFYRVGSGRPSLTWPESVDEALCVGWIDGIRRSVDALSYSIRFTPRRTGSIWSAVNIKRVAALTKEGRMKPAGLAAFRARKEHKSSRYAYEQRSTDLPEIYARRLKKNKAAWAYFEAQAPSYRRSATWWVVSAKKEETREKRCLTLIADSAAGRRLPQFSRWASSAPIRAKAK